MFDEEKAKKDIEKMRKAYDEALKKLEDIEARQEKIAQEIYKARKNTIDKD
jgi:flagellar biosynthesis chaperone FliJ